MNIKIIDILYFFIRKKKLDYKIFFNLENLISLGNDYKDSVITIQ